MPPDDLTFAGPAPVARDECERVLRALPEWFGIEAALVGYACDAEALPTFAARRAGGELVGFLAVRTHFATSAEVAVLAVERAAHRRGVGTRLLADAESWLRGRGARWLHALTLGPSRPDPHYAATRAFYERRGFGPLVELPMLWGDDGANPCLVLVKALARPEW